MAKQFIRKFEAGAYQHGAHGVYSMAIRTRGDFVFLRGQTGFDLDGTFVGRGDPGAQAEQACKNIKQLMLEAGGDIKDVCKLTVFVTDVSYRPGGLRTDPEALRGRPPLQHGRRGVRPGASGAAGRDRCLRGDRPMTTARRRPASAVYPDARRHVGGVRRRAPVGRAPDAVVAHAKLLLLDTLGAALAGVHTDEGRAIRESARWFGGAAGPSASGARRPDRPRPLPRS